MPDLDLHAPDIDITPDLNLKMRIRILAQVILDLAKTCQVSKTDLEYCIRKGIIEKPIIEKIFISFVDDSNITKGEIIFEIDWEKLEFLAKTNENITIINKIDLNKLLAPQLDPALYSELTKFVIRLKKKYRIQRTIISYRYRYEYMKNESILNQTREYLHHAPTKRRQQDTQDFNYELKTAFQGLDGYLDIIIKK